MEHFQLPRERCTTSFVALATFIFLSFHCHSASPTAAEPSYSFVHEGTTSPATSYYDYIIIGGGTAGCPLAATLSRHYNVLLLERGGSPYGNPNITHLRAFGLALADFSPSSPSQPFVSEDGVFNARARVLGGGTCINAGLYSRAEAEFVRAAELDESLVNESYRLAEDELVFRPLVKQWQSGIRNALLEIGITPYNGFSYDHLIGTKVAGTIFDSQGHRHSAADLLKHGDRTKLTVLLHATVQRILFQKALITGRLRAHGVIFKDAEGGTHTAYLHQGPNNEIILSAGAIGSPQLMMLSGLGPKSHLQAHNITVYLDQPNVGQGMADNPTSAVAVPSPVPVEISLIPVVGITPFGSYIEASSGLRFGSQATAVYLKTYLPKPKHQISTQESGAAADSNSTSSPDNLGAQPFRGGFIFEKIIGPLSSGHLELKSRDPDETPAVTFNYFKEPQDLKRCARGVRAILKIIGSKAFSRFKPEGSTPQTLLNMTAQVPVNLLPLREDSSSSPEQYCKDKVITLWHYHGGCQIGRVVDREYRVDGVIGLRVVDSSTFLSSPGTNPQATVMMLGRYVGLKMLRARLKSEKSQ